MLSDILPSVKVLGAQRVTRRFPREAPSVTKLSASRGS
jgi:hypothetical protein